MEHHTQPGGKPEMAPQAVLNQVGLAGLISQALGVAAELGIADLLKDGPKTTADLAVAVSAHEPALYRILRSLAPVGIFAETDARTFVNTPLSDAMRSDVPGSMRAMLRFIARPWHFSVFGNMLHSVQTGETAWNNIFGEELFDWFGKNPVEGKIFNDAMTSMSAIAAPAVVEAYDFSGINVLADIAGGYGFLLSEILQANSDLKGILFDMDHVIAGAGQMLENQGVAHRVETASGDFFEAVPSADGYIMKHIIHDWDDERAIKIMQTIHRAMIGDGRLLLVEMVVPPGNEGHASKVLDLEMLTLPGGLERTEAEYSALFEAAGFRLSKVVPTHTPFSVIEAVKA